MKKLIFTILFFSILINPTFANNKEIINQANITHKISVTKIIFKGFNNGYIKEDIRIKTIKLKAYKEIQNQYKNNLQLNQEIENLIQLLQDDINYKNEMYKDKTISNFQKIFPVLFSNDIQETRINKSIENINNMIDEL